MSKFLYTAIAKNGKEKKGKIEASNKNIAIQTLKESGLYVVSITQENVLNKEITFGQKVTTKDLTVFCQQFEAILNAGVSVLEALHLLKEQTENKFLKSIIEDVYQKVEQGESLSASMNAHSKYFPSILVNMIEAGEASGSLEIALGRMAIHFEKENDVKQTIRKATTYPIAIGIVALVVVTVLVVFVVPTFVDMFNDMGTELPASTKVLLGISDFVIGKWYILIAIIVALIALITFYVRLEVGKTTISRFSMKLPIVGFVNQKIVASRFARTMSTLLASGLPLLDAIEVVSKVVDNYVVSKALLEAKEQVSKGVALSKPIEECGYFPPMITHMVRIGEETGQLEPILNKVANFYDKEVDTSVAQMTTMLEPLIIVIMAVVVGFVVISIMQPMFGMYEGLGNL